jgi:hypothetical protein
LKQWTSKNPSCNHKHKHANFEEGSELVLLFHFPAARQTFRIVLILYHSYRAQPMHFRLVTER